MAKSHEPTDTRMQRLSRITNLLYRHPDGLTVSELARLCEVSIRTISRDIKVIEGAGVPLWDDADEVSGNEPVRHGILGGYYLPPIHLTLDDALALFLAARLLARYADSFDPHIAAALAKLAGVLPESIASHIHATIRDLACRDLDNHFVEVLSTLAIGWASRRAVEIRYRSARSENVHTYTLHPYFIEPSAVGYATYVIGHASWFDALHTFKVERIESATLTRETFVVPEDFDGPALLRDAWGIMYGDPHEELVLRFAPAVTRRVKETCWHPSQELEDRPDGGCVLTLRLAHVAEMVYWVRGWGDQVEVLAPDWLRAQLADEARAVLAQYAAMND